MILATPVLLPKIEPDDWERFWAVWHMNKRPLVKQTPTPNGMYGGKWEGFDVYHSPFFRANYKAEKHDLLMSYPSLWQAIMDVVPRNTSGVRFVESKCPFPAHIDNHTPTWQLRCMFYCENPSEQWYYTRMDGTDERPLKLAHDTNWFAYKDGALKHGTRYDFEKPKILLQVFGATSAVEELALDGIAAFDPQYQVDYDTRNSTGNTVPE